MRACAAVGLVAVFAAAPRTEPAEPPLVRVAYEIQRDSVRGDQWQIDLLGGRRAWQQSTGEGVIVAVIDSGVDAAHPDLVNRVLPGIDLVTGSGDGTADGVGHGTTVAGLIAGLSSDGQGVLGLAPDVKILPVRVLDNNNHYNSAKVVADGVRWAVDHGAKVINLSLGSKAVSSELADAVDYAFAKDVVVVACAGNVLPNEPRTIWHPASQAGVLAVTALGPDGKIWKGSLTGGEAVLAAPGADLVGARPGGYQRVDGTSFAAPLVSATAALVRSRFPHLSAANVVQRLISTARDGGPPGRDEQYGFGTVDPFAALTAKVSEVPANPLTYTPPESIAGLAALQEDLMLPQSVLPSPAASPTAPAHQLASAHRPTSDRPLILLAALAGFAALIGGGLTLLRRL